MSILNPDILYEKYFEEISAIPRGSGNEHGIADYLICFAHERGLKTYRDILNNVVLYVPGTPGYENAPTVILQAHSDMVCVKDPGSKHNFETDGIELIREGSRVHANGTTLGVDDGGGVATILALLADETVQHPPLEAFFTASEEVGMVGAAGFDYSRLHGRRLIGMDSGGENESSVNCATCEELCLSIPLQFLPENDEAFYIRIGGLRGGHSGMAIDQERGNAVKLAAALIRVFQKRGIEIRIFSFHGGSAVNVIPSECEVGFLCHQGRLIEKLTQDFVNDLRRDMQDSEPDLSVVLESTARQVPALSVATSERLVWLLTLLPSGRRHKSLRVEGFVTGSCNLSTIEMTQDVCRIVLFARAETEMKLEEMHDEIRILGELFSSKLQVESKTPCWLYQSHSALRDRAAVVMQEVLGKPLVPCFEHGGMECGYFSANLPGVDIFVIGPVGREAHSTKEWMDLDSAHRVYAFMKQYLSVLKD